MRDVVRLEHEGLENQEKQWMEELCKEGQIKIKEGANGSFSAFFSRMFGLKTSNSEENPTFQGMITKLVRKEYEKNPFYRNFSAGIEKKIKELIKNINQKVSNKLNTSLKDVATRIGGDGFVIDLPQISFEETLDFVFEDEGGKESVVKIRRREQDGVWGSAKRFFGGLFCQDDWGYDEIEYTEEFRVYRKKNVEMSIKNFLDSKLEELKERLDMCIQNIEESVDSQNKKLEISLSDYQSSKIREMEIKQKSSEKELQERKKATQGLIEQRNELLKRIERVSEI